MSKHQNLTWSHLKDCLSFSKYLHFHWSDTLYFIDRPMPKRQGVGLLTYPVRNVRCLNHTTYSWHYNQNGECYRCKQPVCPSHSDLWFQNCQKIVANIDWLVFITNLMLVTIQIILNKKHGQTVSGNVPIYNLLHPISCLKEHSSILVYQNLQHA